MASDRVMSLVVEASKAKIAAAVRQRKKMKGRVLFAEDY